jgi:hypothetical protein
LGFFELLGKSPSVGRFTGSTSNEIEKKTMPIPYADAKRIIN